jgi:hypothetical protein
MRLSLLVAFGTMSHRPRRGIWREKERERERDRERDREGQRQRN